MNVSLPKNTLRTLFFVLCVAVIGLQFSQITRRFVPIVAQIRQDIGKSSGWRGVNFAFGREAADFLQFVNQQTPLDAALLSGDPSGPEYLARPVDLQIFLFPRHVYNCSESEYANCLENVRGEQRAALLTTSETVQTAADRQEYLSFSPNLGLLAVGGGPGETSHRTWGDFASALDYAWSFVPPLLLWVLILAPAILFLASKFETLNAPLHIGFGIALGAGLHSLLTFIFMLAGLALTPALVLVVALLPWLLLVSTRRSLQKNWRRWVDLAHWWPLYTIVVLFTGAAVFIATGTGYSFVDEYLLWASKAYGIVAQDLSVGVSEWGTFTVQYPLNIFLLIANVATVFGDRLPESKIVFPLFYAALLLVAGGYLGSRVKISLASLAALMLASSPLLFFHSTIGYANLALSLYLVSGFLAGIMAVERRSAALALLTGSLIALAAWTRTEGLAMGAVFLAILALVWWLDKSREWRTVFMLVLPLGVFYLFWAFTAPMIYTGGGFAQGVFTIHFSELLKGNLNPVELVFTMEWLLRYVFSLEPTAWGGLGTLPIFSLLVFLLRRQRPKQNELSLFVAGTSILAIVAVGYFMTSYSPAGPDVSWWVLTGMDRMIMPGIVLIWLAGVAAAERLLVSENESRR